VIGRAKHDRDGQNVRSKLAALNYIKPFFPQRKDSHRAVATSAMAYFWPA